MVLVRAWSQNYGDNDSSYEAFEPVKTQAFLVLYEYIKRFDRATLSLSLCGMGGISSSGWGLLLYQKRAPSDHPNPFINGQQGSPLKKLTHQSNDTVHSDGYKKQGLV